MAPRAYWTGHLRLSLVSMPVRLYTATSGSHKLSLHQVHRKTGERVRQQLIVPEHGPVPKDEIAKGYEYEKGRFVLIEQEEIDKLKVESKKTIEIVQFVDAAEVDPIYYEKPYFVVPDGPIANEAYIVVRDALRQTKKVGLGQVVLAGRENIAAIRPCSRGLLLETLRYADEVRDAALYFEDVPETAAEPDQLDLANELIRRKTAPFDPSMFRDEYQAALQELVKAKIEDRPPETGTAPRRPSNVVNLMDALKRSLGDEQGADKKAPKKAGKGAKAKSADEGKTPARKRKSA